MAREAKPVQRAATGVPSVSEEAPPPTDDTAGSWAGVDDPRAPPTIKAWANEWHLDAADKACEFIAALPDAFLDPKRSLLWVDDANDCPARLVYATAPTVTDLLGRAGVTCWERKKATTSPIATPSQLVTTVLSRRSPTARWKKLRGLASGPYMLADGSIIQEQGYHAGAGLWLPTAGTIPIPTEGRGSIRPEGFTQEEGRDTLAWMIKELAEFPFADPAFDPAVTVAYFLTLITRPAYRTCPIFIFDASVKRSGKDLLFKFWETAAFGREAKRINLVAEDEENEKRLATALIEGHTSIVFSDSVNIGWPQLYSIITEGEAVSVRQLGSNTSIPVPPTLTLGANGNNLAIKQQDLLPRMIVLRLEPTVADPSTVPHEKDQDALLGYARSNRRALLAAGFNLVRGFLNRPDPKPVGGISEGSFPGWAALVRDPLLWYGWPDLLLSRSRFAATSTVGDDEEDAAFVAAWWGVVGDRTVTSRHLLDLASVTELYDEDERKIMPIPARIALAAAIKDVLGKANHTPTALSKRIGRIKARPFAVGNGIPVKVWLGDHNNQKSVQLRRVG